MIKKNSIPYIFIAGVAFFMFRGIFASGFMSGYDNSFHYYDTYYLTQTLIPEYHWISGWSMQGLAGFPVFVDYYQTGFWAIAILNKILFLPLNLSYKLMVLASYIILGAGFYKLASNRFGKIPALFVTVCLMLQKDIYCGRILGGMWHNYLAIGLFFIFFHILDKNFKAMTMRKALVLGLFLGIIILTHLYVAIFAFILLIIYMVPYAIEAFKNRALFKQFLIYSAIPILAFMVSSYYLYGFIVARGYFEKLGAEPLTKGLVWGMKSFFGPLESVNSVASFMINIPIIIRIIFSFFGICIFFKKEKNPDTKRLLWCVFWFTGISLVLFTHILARFSWWQRIPLVTTLQISRFLIYVQIGFYLFAAYGLARFLKRFRRKSLVITACVVPLLFSIFFHYTYFGRDASRTLEQSPQMPSVYKVWNWVDENIPPGEARIVYQNTVGNVNDPIFRRSDVFALSGVFTKVPQIGVSRSASPFPQEKYMRNDQGRIFGKPLDSLDPSYVRKMMNHFNAGHIVTVEHDLGNMLGKSDLFSKEADFGIFSIFKLKEFTSEWISFKDDARYEIEKFENQRLIFNVWNRNADNKAFIKVAYHPFWQAQLNGKPANIILWDKKRFGLMTICLPEKGVYKIDLSFDSRNPLWPVSLLSFITCTFVIILKSKIRNA